MTTDHPDHSLSGHLWLGMRGRCPRCGQGDLFDGFLKITDRCSVCQLHFIGHDAGDAPAVAVTFVLGFGIIAIAAWFELTFAPPFWVHAVLWIPAIVIGSIGLLRPLKGMTVALQHRYRSVEEPEKLGGQ